MPGEIATYLLGVQGGVEDDFARLYEATNPVLVRYLRVTTDGDTSSVALDAWSKALQQLTVCPADDDAWLELVVGSAQAAAAATAAAPVTTAAAADGAAATTSPTDSPSADPDEVDHAVEALRACPPDEATVLAMGVVANLGREATSRLTGHEPGAVLELVHHGQERLTMSFEELIVALRAPARPDEVADLALVTPLMAAALNPAPAAVATIGKGAAWADAFEASLAEPSLVELLGIEAAAASSVHLTAVGSPTGTPSRSARAGVGAAVWVVALGGVGAAAAMSGLLTAAVDGVLGDHGKVPVITAEGPVTPGTPSTGDGGTTGNPPVGPGTEPGTAGPSRPGVTPAGEPSQTGGGGGSQAVSLPGGTRVVQIQLASFVPSGTPTPTGTPTTPTPTTPNTPTTPAQPVVPPTSVAGPTVSVGGGSTKAAAKAAKATAKADKAKARAAAKAKAKAHKASAKSSSKAAKASAKSSHKAKSGKAKAGKAVGHHKDKAKGKAVGHHKSKSTTRA